MTQTAQTAVQTRTQSNTASILFAAILGLGIVIVAGHIQAATLHDAAHDTRHATGFPCH